MKWNQFICGGVFAIAGSICMKVQAQQFIWYKSTPTVNWQQQQVHVVRKSKQVPELVVDTAISLSTFDSWGTCFNELGWDALHLLSGDKRDTIFTQLFSSFGDLRFSLGRIPMNANDYARDWYSSDEVAGDFSLKYFNIDRDKQTLIPFIKEAQRKNPSMTFWLSPWSPPSWMKANHHYAVRSDKKFNQLAPASDILLFGDQPSRNEPFFPRQLAVNDYLIQDPRFMKAYALYFCKFIDAYKSHGIPIKTVMYQNEPFSYTVYPGCAWTVAGTIRFNVEYLHPALQAQHPDVSLFLGTINSNRYDFIEEVLKDPRMKTSIRGIGFQWEGGQILPRIRAKFPEYTFVQTESECGWGAFDWKAAEHTFDLINHYIGNGCTQYTFWNAILADDGYSTWGWKQNALIRVSSMHKTVTYTPEFFAVKHYSHFVAAGSRLIGWKATGDNKKPVLVFLSPAGKLIVIAGNFKDQPQTLHLAIGNKALEATLEAHSLNTFVAK